MNYLLTHHSNMDAPQCVHHYVPSDYVLLTQHSTIEAPQYVHIDVPSDYMCY